MSPGDLVTDGMSNHDMVPWEATVDSTPLRLGILLWIELGSVDRRSRVEPGNGIACVNVAGVLWNTGRLEEVPLAWISRARPPLASNPAA